MNTSNPQPVNDIGALVMRAVFSASPIYWAANAKTMPRPLSEIVQDNRLYMTTSRNQHGDVVKKTIEIYPNQLERTFDAYAIRLPRRLFDDNKIFNSALDTSNRHNEPSKRRDIYDLLQLTLKSSGLSHNVFDGELISVFKGKSTPAQQISDGDDHIEKEKPTDYLLLLDKDKYQQLAAALLKHMGYPPYMQVMFGLDAHDEPELLKREIQDPKGNIRQFTETLIRRAHLSAGQIEAAIQEANKGENFEFSHLLKTLKPVPGPQTEKLLGGVEPKPPAFRPLP